ncbi:hypothetical protein [Fontivita pretiosa]|uniref:hypothetical protein n=1 Tax=Fontivita pretiosa TaxID=2989684 RepID=UPI003D180B02
MSRHSAGQFVPPSQRTANAFAWQGWRMELPARWNPVRLEGDFEQGAALIADLHRPRLGIRWRKAPSRRFDPAAWAMQAMRDEVGKRAADEAKPLELSGDRFAASSVYLEPQPPGRDVWLAFSRASGRCVQIVHHANRRETILVGAILPTFEDLGGRDGPMPWAVFDLSCLAPAGMKLTGHCLNAGDLSLTFADKHRIVTIRQVALAELALKRKPLKQWLADQESRRQKYHRPIAEPTELELSCDDGRRLTGLVRTMVRRKRFFFLRALWPELRTAALHDPQRDRIVIVQASDDALIREAATGVGWSAPRCD